MDSSSWIFSPANLIWQLFPSDLFSSWSCPSMTLMELRIVNTCWCLNRILLNIFMDGTHLVKDSWRTGTSNSSRSRQTDLAVEVSAVLMPPPTRKVQECGNTQSVNLTWNQNDPKSMCNYQYEDLMRIKSSFFFYFYKLSCGLSHVSFICSGKRKS